MNAPPTPDLILPLRSGGRDVIPTRAPRRLALQAVMVALGQTPSDVDPAAVGLAVAPLFYAVVGLAWAGSQQIPNLPRRPAFDIFEYGEAVADGLYALGYDVDSEDTALAAKGVFEWALEGAGFAETAEAAEEAGEVFPERAEGDSPVTP